MVELGVVGDYYVAAFDSLLYLLESFGVLDIPSVTICKLISKKRGKEILLFHRNDLLVVYHYPIPTT